MSPRFFTACGVVLLALSASAHAGQAEICYSPAVAFAQNPQPPTNATLFNCPISGSKTLVQLAAAGWQVVQMLPVVTTSGSPPTQMQTDQLVIQKP